MSRYRYEFTERIPERNGSGKFSAKIVGCFEEGDFVIDSCTNVKSGKKFKPTKKQEEYIYDLSCEEDRYRLAVEDHFEYLKEFARGEER